MLINNTVVLLVKFLYIIGVFTKLVFVNFFITFFNFSYYKDNYQLFIIFYYVLVDLHNDLYICHLHKKYLLSKHPIEN